MAVTASMVKELRERTGLGMMDCKKALVETEGNMDDAIRLLKEKGAIKSAKKSGRETNEGVVKIFKSDDEKEHLMIMMSCETDFVVRNEHFQKLVDEIGNEILKNKSISCLEDVPESITTKITEGITTIGENLKLSKINRMKEENDSEYVGNYIHSNSKIGTMLKVKFENPGNRNNNDLKNLVGDLCMQIAAMNVKALTKDDVDDKLIAEEKEIYMKQAKESGKPESIIEKIVDGKINKIYSEITLMGQSFVKDDKFTVEKYVNKVSQDLNDKVVPREFTKFVIGD